MRFLCQPSSNEALTRFFDEGFVARWYPDLDVIEEQNRYVVKLDLPGLKKEEIKVSVENNILTITGERKVETETKVEGQQVHRSERSYGRFARALNLGTQVDYNNIQASYKDGVLEVTVPKTEASKPKTVDIQIG